MYLEMVFVSFIVFPPGCNCTIQQLLCNKRSLNYYWLKLLEVNFILINFFNNNLEFVIQNQEQFQIWETDTNTTKKENIITMANYMATMTNLKMNNVGRYRYFDSTFWDLLPQIIAHMFDIKVIIWNKTDTGFYESIFSPNKNYKQVIFRNINTDNNQMISKEINLVLWNCIESHYMLLEMV